MKKEMENIKAVVVVAVALLAITANGTMVVLPSMMRAAIPANLSGTLTIAGSTTILPINEECGRLLRESNPDLRISVSGGGSGHGIKAVGAGEIDIGAASRDVKTGEKEQYPDLKTVTIGRDSVSIVVHPSNTLNDLSLEQASKIFSGEIMNWKEVGGADAAIRVITREEGSGTRETFEKYVMAPFKREIAGSASVKPSNGEVRATVSSGVSCIGYLSLGYLDKTVKAIRLGGVEATVENVRSGAYPITRNLYLITKGEPSELEKTFIEFVLSNDGQIVVEDMGYIALAPLETPTPTPILTPTPTPIPGFEAICAIVSLLAVIPLVQRSRG